MNRKLAAISFLFGIALLTTLAAYASRAVCCPFCAATSQTFSEEIGAMDVVAIATLVEPPPPPKPRGESNPLEDIPRGKFEVIQVIKGSEHLKGKKIIETIYLGEAKKGKTFLIMGVDPPSINYSTPLPLSERGHKYISQLGKLPKEGAGRLEFFQNYLEDADEMLARDAYDEFAKSPYDVVKGLKGKMKHDQVVAWIQDGNIPASRRRLYLTMLGVCGGMEDLPMLETLLKSEDRKNKAGLDAMIACYLTLKGPEGMPLIEDLFLKNQKAEYADTYAAIMALRFHGTESNAIPKERLLKGLHHMLDRPQLADLVIPDLARWEDWSVAPRLVKLFKEADEKTSWVRVPVINYLRACPKPEAKDYIKELEKVDPAAVKRANTFFPFTPSGNAPVPAATDSNSQTTPEAPVKVEVGKVETGKGEVLAQKAVVSSSVKSGGDIAAARYKALKQKAVAAATPKAEPVETAATLPNLWLAIGVPWLAGAVLMLVQWTILRGRGGIF